MLAIDQIAMSGDRSGFSHPSFHRGATLSYDPEIETLQGHRDLVLAMLRQNMLGKGTLTILIIDAILMFSIDVLLCSFHRYKTYRNFCK